MQAIILAGGVGTHLHALDAHIAKPMLPLFDRPLIEHAVELLTNHGITDIVIAASSNSVELARHLGDGARFGARLRYSIERDPLGTAGALKLAAQMVEDTFVVTSGDVVTDCDISAAISAHRASGAIATVAVATAEDPTEFGVVEHDASGRIIRLVEKPKSSEVFSDTVNAGIYVLSADVLSSIPYFTRSDFATNTIPRLINNGERVQAFLISGYWRDISTLRQCKMAHFDALRGKIGMHIPGQEIAAGMWIGDRVEIDAKAEIVPPVYLGTGASIRKGAVVGPEAVIGCETMVEESARVAHAVVGGGCLIARGARVEDSLIGSGCCASEGEEIEHSIVFEYARYDQTTGAPAAAAPIEIRSTETQNSVSV